MIVVVGSVNRDLVVSVERHPRPGETVLGRGHFTTGGGKGANQAVAAARLGADVHFVGRVGADAGGDAAISDLRHEGVGTAALARDERAATGLALITVDAAGENSIVVDSGANGLLEPADIDAVGVQLAAATVTLLQLEVTLDAVQRAADRSGGMVILNPAPAQALPDALLAAVDVIVPNLGELETLTGSSDPVSLRDLPVPVGVVTLGAEGVAVVRDREVVRIPAPEVTSVDTTGAGDAFCGAFAAGLDSGSSLETAARDAVVAAAMAVTAPGARGGMPGRAELAAFARRLESR